MSFRAMKKLLMTALLCLTAAGCSADWSGKVVGVHDGDTLTVMRYGQGVKVRLNEIDAPELGQAYGRQSKQSLSELCFGRQAEVRKEGQDRYGRTLGRVFCAGTDANAEQLRRGYAWFYQQYGRDPLLKDLEASARSRRVGLWADRDPTPPWNFRHGKAGGNSGPSPRAGSAQKSSADHCGGGKKTCADMGSCEEALYYLHRCGMKGLDRNHDGLPCESLCR
jgi:endonuclease YncB( thermonuclease family)